MTSPDASKDLLAPSGESTPSLWKLRVERGWRIRLEAPTIAASHCPERIERTAWSITYRPVAHAVSTAKLGPVMNKQIRN